MSAPKPDVTVAALLARIRRLGSPDPDTSAADLLRDIDALSAIVVDATWGDRSTQADMAMALLGAVIAQAVLGRRHDRELERLALNRG